MVKYTNLKHNYLLKTVLRDHRVLKVTWTVEHLFRKVEFMPLSYLKIAQIFFFFFNEHSSDGYRGGIPQHSRLQGNEEHVHGFSAAEPLAVMCWDYDLSLFFLYAGARNNLSTHLFFLAP